MAPHSSTLAWKLPWTEEPGELQSMGSQRVRHDWATLLTLFTFLHWRGKWQPTPVFLPGESQGWWSLVGCCLWGCTESDTTEATYSSSSSRTPPCVSSFIFLLINFYCSIVTLQCCVCFYSTTKWIRRTYMYQFSSVPSLSHVRLFATPWIAARQASLSITISRSSLRLVSIESVMPSSHLILCRPLLLLPPILPHQSLFQWVNSSHEVAKGLEFQL